MKLFLVMIAMLMGFSAWGQEKGIGISLGNPTGLNAKYWLNSQRAIDAGLAFSIGKKTELSLHSDYLFHKEAALYFNEVHPMDLYFGFGGRMEFSDDIQIGGRFPVGVTHRFEQESADVFAEVAPIIDIIGRTGLELHLLFGGRYYF